jgi:endonuclease YncB( thermonuclease family)
MAKYGDKSRYNLSLYEKETVILYNDEDKIGTIYTCNAALIRKMDKLVLKYPDTFSLKYEDEVSKTYYVPKKLISIKTPRIYTPEQKQKMQEQGIKAMTFLRQRAG